MANVLSTTPNAKKKYVTKIGPGFGYQEEIPIAKGKRCYSMNGFSLHCNTSTNTHARDRLEKLIEYIARGPLSNERVELTCAGQVKLKLKTPWSGGVTHLLLTPAEFLEKLTAIIPLPTSHLVRWGGGFAANAALRRQIVLKPEQSKGFDFAGEAKVKKNKTWSRMLARVFKIDVLRCHCGSELSPIAAIQDPYQARRYLQHLGLDGYPPARRLPRLEQVSFEFDDLLQEHSEA